VGWADERLLTKTLNITRKNLHIHFKAQNINTMNFSRLIFAAFVAFLMGCQSLTPTAFSSLADAQVEVIDDRKLHHLFGKKINEMVAEDKVDLASGKELLSQLKRRSCQLSLPKANRHDPRHDNIYQKSVDHVVMLGRSYRCPKEKCKRLHWSIASGVLIHPDGIIASNYHVVNAAGKTQAMAAMTRSGEMYGVSEVLAADEKSDVAILKLAGAKDLSYATITKDEPVGNPVTVISHPNRKFFLLTKGYISRYYYREPGVSFMNITADYAKGSSGGPLFNEQGHLIGLVSSTTSLSSRSVQLNHVKPGEAQPEATKKEPLPNKKNVIQQGHQMTLKNCVPSRAILSLIEN